MSVTISVDRYHEMIEAGVLVLDDPIELLEGVLTVRPPKSPPHCFVTRTTEQALAPIVPTGWHVKAQDPITLADSEPEPDVAVIRGAERDYLGRHPGAADVILVVEVADSTLTRDRVVKMRIYARAGIPSYWIVDLTSNTVETYSDPQDGVYRQREIYRSGQQVDTPFGQIAASQFLP